MPVTRLFPRAKCFFYCFIHISKFQHFVLLVSFFFNLYRCFFLFIGIYFIYQWCPLLPALLKHLFNVLQVTLAHGDKWFLTLLFCSLCYCQIPPLCWSCLSGYFHCDAYPFLLHGLPMFYFYDHYLLAFVFMEASVYCFHQLVNFLETTWIK